MNPHLTTSARPRARRAAAACPETRGRRSPPAVGGTRRPGSCRAPRSTPVLPPTEASTIASSVVGIGANSSRADRRPRRTRRGRSWRRRRCRRWRPGDRSRGRPAIRRSSRSPSGSCRPRRPADRAARPAAAGPQRRHQGARARRRPPAAVDQHRHAGRRGSNAAARTSAIFRARTLRCAPRSCGDPARQMIVWLTASSAGCESAPSPLQDRLHHLVGAFGRRCRCGVGARVERRRAGAAPRAAPADRRCHRAAAAPSRARPPDRLLRRHRQRDHAPGRQHHARFSSRQAAPPPVAITAAAAARPRGPRRSRAA